LADDYLIGYRLTTRNAQIIDESLTVSKAMLPCPRDQKTPLLLRRENNETIERLLKREQTLFLEYASVQPIRLKSNETLNGTDIKSLQTLTLPTQCYAVEFNDRLVTITLLQHNNEK
jgi:hypothetical protein